MVMEPTKVSSKWSYSRWMKANTGPRPRRSKETCVEFSDMPCTVGLHPLHEASLKMEGATIVVYEKQHHFHILSCVS